ncbi:MAG: hypothetical protein SFU56_09395 [Capsulimonadales bacterium]|nr:hypothetical protein [Capsulimonadales bacterium]
MSLLLSVAARRAYDALKSRPGANPRESGARDDDALTAVIHRLHQLIDGYRLNERRGPNGHVYVFWFEISREIENGAFDDLLDRL